ncbi:MAG: ATP-binding protein [Saccharofermentanales bacterium]|jgi:DNA replication protein DnaC|nr:ATP-binding protein [Clostridiaceae bacterium]
MQSSIARAVAREYERRRQQAEYDRDQRVLTLHARLPELAELDRAIAAAGADLLMESVDPGRPRRAAAEKNRLLDARLRLLQESKTDPHYDQIIFNCPLCQDTGMIQQRQCSCYRKILIPLLSANANLRQIESHSFATFDAGLFSDQPDPSRYQSDLSPRQQILGLKQASRRFIAAFDHPETRNLLFVGKPGTGKTFLMACIAKEMLNQGRSVLYMPAPQLFAAMQEHRTMLATFNPDIIRLEKAVALYDSLMNCDLLLIDDLGTEAGAASRYADLLSVIDARALPDRKTIISSNADPATLRDTYDERLLSRLMGGFAIYRFFGDDVRLVLSRKKKKGRS